VTGPAPADSPAAAVDLTGIAIDGRFALPPLANLAGDDQVFVAAFVRCHGSIKQMEQYFGVSYPTIKNRLNRIGAQLPFAEIDPEPEPGGPSTRELLSQLERGTLSVDEVVRQLRKPPAQEKAKK
jgi:hypothetical protein